MLRDVCNADKVTGVTASAFAPHDCHRNGTPLPTVASSTKSLTDLTAYGMERMMSIPPAMAIASSTTATAKSGR